MSEPEHVTLAREAQAAGLIVTHLTPAHLDDRFHIQLWQPDGTLWVEGWNESAAMIRAHIAHWPAHRQALTEPGLRLVIPGDGQALTCGCVTDTPATEEDAERHGQWGHCRDPHCKPCTDAWGELDRGSHYTEEDA